MDRFLTSLAFIGSLALAACVEPAPIPPSPSQPVEDTCGASEFQYLVGQDVSPVFAVTFTQPIRIIRPGDSVTMDFSEERMNFNLDDKDIVLSVTCG
jgi:hypothetical protein